MGWTPLDGSLAAGRYAELPRGSQHPRHPQEAPSALFFLLSGPWSSSRPSGHKAGTSRWERQRRRNTPGVRQTPDPANRPPQPSPALRGLLTSHGKSCWGVAPGGRILTWPHALGLPTCRGNLLLFVGTGAVLSSWGASCQSKAVSLLPVKGWVGHSPWAPAARGPAKLIRPHQHHNTRPWALQHKAGPSSMIREPGLGTRQRLQSWRDVSVTQEFQG